MFNNSNPPASRDNSPAIACLGLGAGLVGSFMTWISIVTIFGGLEFKGTKGDGQITVVLAIVAAAFALADRYGWSAGLSLLGVGVSGYDLLNINSKASELSTGGFSASAGDGLYVCLGGFVVAAVFFFKANTERKLSEAAAGIEPVPRTAAEIQAAYRHLTPPTIIDQVRQEELRRATEKGLGGE